MAIDLTRFDFYALRFSMSENVRSMSAEEVGQYILLLVDSWLGGKGASLPDDPSFLSRIARVGKVSDKVLEMFPLEETEFGWRRRNPTLYAEWQVVTNRSTVASEMGKKGNEVRWGGDRPPINPSIAQSNPNQLKPIQTNSNQSNISDGDFSGQMYNFKNIKIRYFSHFGKTQSDAKRAKHEYQEVCQKYGEDKVLEYFEIWAPQNKNWIREGYTGNNGLQFFYRKLPEMIEGDALREEREAKEEPEVKYIKDQEAVDAYDADIQARLKQIEEDKEFAEAHRDEI